MNVNILEPVDKTEGENIYPYFYRGRRLSEILSSLIDMV